MVLRIHVLEGNAVSYKRGVSVTDNKDKDITFQVDSSKVNINKVGTYRSIIRHRIQQEIKHPKLLLLLWSHLLLPMKCFLIRWMPY